MSFDPESVLRFWFGDDLDSPAAVGERSALWFGSDAGFDAALRKRFADAADAAGRGDLDAWSASPRSALALVLLLDQLPRNLHRNDARAFAQDPRALAAALAAIEAGHDRAVHPVEAGFFYLPLEHAEDLALQERCVESFEALGRRAPDGLAGYFARLADYARRHRDVVARFGRFPHRNDALGRATTPGERAYLEGGGERFGAEPRKETGT
jgi:uncharacterized protein (DUF924 family)